MVLKSFAKINLSLIVGSKQKNKLHNIQSHFCLIDLFDEIKIKKIKGQKDIIKFSGKFSKYINKSNNSIMNTIKILRERKIISNYYSINVKKQVPTFAGLGGGTSNAVFLAKYFTKNIMKKEIISILEKKIGTDFRIFFYKQGFLVNLKKVNNFKKRYKLYFLLASPNIRCSTKLIYSKVNKYSSKINFDFKKINNKFKFIRFLANKKNDLQSIVEKKYPIVSRLLSEISQNEGCYFSRMTGSGSVCYGVFRNKKRAKTALNKIKSKYPKFWVSSAKTI